MQGGRRWTTCHPRETMRPMNSQNLQSRARLEQVEALLRDVLLNDFDGESRGEGGSLGRMLVHVVNIHHAVSLTPEGHENAAKRLGDFARTMERLTARKPESAARLARLAEVMRAASSEL